MAKPWLRCGFSIIVAAFCAHPEELLGSMLAHVGSCWGHAGLRCPRVGPKMAQDCSMLAQTGSKTPKMAPKGLQSSPRWALNGFKMASKSIRFSSVLVFPRFSKILHVQGWGSFERSRLGILWTWHVLIMFWTTSDQYSSNFGIFGRVCLKWPQDSSKLPYFCQSGSILAKLAQVGPMLDPSWLQLGSSWPNVGPICGSPAAPGPTQALPDPFPVASWPPKPPLALYKTQNKSPKGLPNLQVGP